MVRFELKKKIKQKWNKCKLKLEKFNITISILSKKKFGIF